MYISISTQPVSTRDLPFPIFASLRAEPSMTLPVGVVGEHTPRGVSVSEALSELWVPCAVGNFLWRICARSHVHVCAPPP